MKGTCFIKDVWEKAEDESLLYLLYERCTTFLYDKKIEIYIYMLYVKCC